MKKNILFIIGKLGNVGGAEKLVSTLGTKLNEGKDYNVKYLTFYDVKEKYSFTGEEICLNEKLSYNFFIKIVKLFTRASKIKEICKKENIDFTLSHMEEANFSNIISKVIFRNTAKIFIQIHQNLNAWGKIYKILIKLLYKYADKIITIVEEEKINLINNFHIKKEKIVVIHNMIDIKKIDVLKKLPLPTNYQDIFKKDIFTFINIGRLTFQKNQKMLLEVFIKFQKKYPHTQLLILGYGDLKEDLIQLIGDNTKIQLLGNQENPYNFLYNSDCFILSSRYEGLPIILLEAMTCSVPIISTDCKTGPKEILSDFGEKIFEEVTDISHEKYGILIPVFDKEKMYQAMEEVYLQKDLREKYACLGREGAKKYDIETIITQWGDIFK